MVEQMQAGVSGLAPLQRELVHHHQLSRPVGEQAIGRAEQRHRIDVLRALLKQQRVPGARGFVEILQPRLAHGDGVAMPDPRGGDLCRVGRDAHCVVTGSLQPRQRGTETDAHLQQAAGRRQGMPQQRVGALLGRDHIVLGALEDAEVQVIDTAFLDLEQVRVDVQRKGEVAAAHDAREGSHRCGSATRPCCSPSCTTSKLATCSAAA